MYRFNDGGRSPSWIFKSSKFFNGRWREECRRVGNADDADDDVDERYGDLGSGHVTVNTALTRVLDHDVPTTTAFRASPILAMLPNTAMVRITGNII